MVKVARGIAAHATTLLLDSPTRSLRAALLRAREESPRRVDAEREAAVALQCRSKLAGPISHRL